MRLARRAILPAAPSAGCPFARAIQPGEEKLKQALAAVEKSVAAGDRDYLQGARDTPERPPADVEDLSNADTPQPHAGAILRRLQWHKRYSDEAYLRAAEQQARLAYVRFMDDTCPLPKAFAGGPRKTVAGDPFPDFTFRGAKLMHAFALLGEAGPTTPRSARRAILPAARRRCRATRWARLPTARESPFLQMRGG